MKKTLRLGVVLAVGLPLLACMGGEDTIDFDFQVEGCGTHNEDGLVSPGEHLCVMVFLTPDISTSDESPTPTGEVAIAVTGELVVPADPYVTELTLTNDTTHEFSTQVETTWAEITAEGSTAVVEVVVVVDDGETYGETQSITITPTTAQLVADSWLATHDTNDDGTINPGEDITVDLFIRNAGPTASLDADVTATLLTDGVEFTSSPERQLTRLDPDEVGSISLSLEVSPDVTEGTQISIELWMLEEHGHVWQEVIQLPVVATTAQLVYASHELTHDDGIPRAGDWEDLTVRVENIGASTAPSVSAVLSATDSRVTIGSNERSLGTIEPGEEASTSFGFDLAKDTPAGTDLAFFLTLEDDLGNIYTDSFTITEGSGGIGLSLTSSAVNQISGDGDDHIEAGESFYLELDVRNTGAVDARDVRVTLDTLDTHVDLADDDHSFGDIGAGETVSSGDGLRFTVLASHAPGPLTLQATLKSGVVETVEIIDLEVR